MNSKIVFLLLLRWKMSLMLLKPHESLTSFLKLSIRKLVNQYAEREGVPEQMKADEMMKWGGTMNSIRTRVEEVIMVEYIYEDD